MLAGLERACQLLLEAVRGRECIPCRVVFELLEPATVATQLEVLNETMALLSMRVLRIKHKGIYCLTVVDDTEQSAEYYSWLKSVLPADTMRVLNEERGAYIFVRILLHTLDFDCELEDLLTLLAETALPPMLEPAQYVVDRSQRESTMEAQNRASDNMNSNDKRCSSSESDVDTNLNTATRAEPEHSRVAGEVRDAREAWRETIARFVARGWLQKQDTRINSIQNLPQAIIAEDAIMAFLTSESTAQGGTSYDAKAVMHKFKTMTDQFNGN